MLKFRFKEKQNVWPAFVDLFSNLVIILIFLLIVFIFLWTTTNVFNKKSGVKAVAELKKINEEQAQTIEQMSEDEQEAKRLLVLAKTELESLSENKQNLEQEIQETNTNLDEIVNSYENKIKDLQKSGDEMKNQISELHNQLSQLNIEKENILEKEKQKIKADVEAQKISLMEELIKLQEALDKAEAKSKEQEIKYVEMSSRLNKALADKVAELNSTSGYQSSFYKAIKIAIGDRTTVKPNGDRFIVSSDILFKSGEFNLSKEGKNQLKLIANVIKDFELKIPTDINWIIRIDGHTDNKQVISGNRKYKNNIELSLLRAIAVSNELIKNGVSKRRLVPSGFGELHPIELGKDKKSLEKNRRIELRLTNK